MQAPLYVTPPLPFPMPEPPTGSAELADLLRQLLTTQQEQVALLRVQASAEVLRQVLAVQTEQLNLLRAQAANQDQAAKYKAFLGKWAAEFPDLGAACRQAMPAIERAYLHMIRELTDRVRGDDPDELENEFALNEFLDRYGIRLGQLATVMSQIGPLAEAAPPEGS